MARTGRAVLALVGVAAGLLTAGAVPRAHAETIGDARARAAALSHTVQRLQTEAEVATERYDAVQAELTTAVAQRGQADQRLAAMQANAQAAQQAVTDRTRALYESG